MLLTQAGLVLDVMKLTAGYNHCNLRCDLSWAVKKGGCCHTVLHPETSLSWRKAIQTIIPEVQVLLTQAVLVLDVLKTDCRLQPLQATLQAKLGCQERVLLPHSVAG